MINRIAASLLAGALMAVPAAAAPVKWAGNGNFYEYVTSDTGFTWTDAKADAEGRTHKGRKGHLVTITSAEEEAFLYANLRGALLYGDPWIGAFREAGSDPLAGWQWVTGEAFSYTNWRSNEPNNTAPDERELYAHYLSTGVGGDDLASGWNDLLDASRRGYLVEYEAVPEPGALAMLALGVLGVAARRRRRG